MPVDASAARQRLGRPVRTVARPERVAGPRNYTGPSDGPAPPAPFRDGRRALRLGRARLPRDDRRGPESSASHDFGAFATVMSATGFVQTLLDLTVEEALTKFGFRYVAARGLGPAPPPVPRGARVQARGRRARARRRCSRSRRSPTRCSATSGLALPIRCRGAAPLGQAPENVAATALLLRGRYDLRGGCSHVSMALRLVGIAIGAHYRRRRRRSPALSSAQVISTAVVGVGGPPRFAVPARRPRPLGRRPPRDHLVRRAVERRDRRALAARRRSRRCSSASSRARPRSASPRRAGAAVRLLGARRAGAAGAAHRADARLGARPRRRGARGVRRYMLGAAARRCSSRVPSSSSRCRGSSGSCSAREYLDAIDAARILLVAAAMQLVVGWTKSFPVTIGRPRLRILTHGARDRSSCCRSCSSSATRWGVTGAAVAILVSTLVFALVVGRLARSRCGAELRTARGVGGRGGAAREGPRRLRDLAARRRRAGEPRARVAAFLLDAGMSVEVVTTAAAAPARAAYPVHWVSRSLPAPLRAPRGRARGRARRAAAPTSSTRRACSGAERAGATLARRPLRREARRRPGVRARAAARAVRRRRSTSSRRRAAAPRRALRARRATPRCGARRTSSPRAPTCASSRVGWGLAGGARLGAPEPRAVAPARSRRATSCAPSSA